jgi:hypothetical protein
MGPFLKSSTVLIGAASPWVGLSDTRPTFFSGRRLSCGALRRSACAYVARSPQQALLCSHHYSSVDVPLSGLAEILLAQSVHRAFDVAPQGPGGRLLKFRGLLLDWFLPWFILFSCLCPYRRYCCPEKVNIISTSYYDSVSHKSVTGPSFDSSTLM